MPRIGLGVAGGARAMEKAILEAIRRHLDAALVAAAPAIQKRFGALCDHLIAGTEEYQSLINGDLRGEFGLATPEGDLGAILRAIRDGVVVERIPVRVKGSGLTGGLRISMIKSNYQDILGLTQASYVSQPSGERIDWLDWLLTRGDKIIVNEHHVDFVTGAAERARSRSSMALMRPGSTWRVPSWASGTSSDNFILRAFNVSGVEAEMARILEDEIGSRL